MLRAMSADQKARRPRLLAPGLRIGMHVQVERVIRQSANRTYYLVNNGRRRWSSVKCWECGKDFGQRSNLKQHGISHGH